MKEESDSESKEDMSHQHPVEEEKEEISESNMSSSSSKHHLSFFNTFKNMISGKNQSKGYPS